ncbi:double-strand break repair protein AddB [Roseobacter weihaiensis]|uniref:double-strand break repair protein AddB n=1 Tax=Roseobacter weihaiensis TaxID=2763262 RepID=UPI001D0AAE01|nr:double-strand break repair protein AddB [Roseobacter sp. H9]
MFEPTGKPRLFGLAPGVDFPKGLMAGLIARAASSPPESLGRVQLIVNTARMERRLQQLFDAGPPRILPRISLLTHLDLLDPAVVVPPAVSPLRRRLELISLVARLIDQQQELAPRSSLYDLTDSLAALMDEMQGEGVSAEEITALDVSDESGHWQRAQTFITIAQSYLRQTTTIPDKEARQRQLVRALAERWTIAPPEHPVILAGSTGSRGTTMLLMEAIAQLPQGALVLPGFDFDLPTAQWVHLGDAMVSEDHPQFRFYKLMQRLGVGRGDIQPWHDRPPPSPARNALVSLSLRPAPVTDAWLSEGPRLQDLEAATENITLVEAPNPRSEALTIALRLRKAVAEGQKAAVITPDRMLTRQITAALDQWDILPDDSAGTPLHLSPPGRFLRHLAALFHRRLDAEALLTLLKHPLTHSSSDRGTHVLNTQRLELRIRRDGLPYPDAQGILARLRAVLQTAEQQAEVDTWAAWIGATFTGQDSKGERPLLDWVTRHMALAEAVSSGPNGADTGEVWQKNAGQEALKVMTNLRDQAAYGGLMTASDYANLVGALLADGEIRDRDAPHPDIMIWGTLEARVQGADLVILAGLNDGTWPEAPNPDPWLNRSLRNKAGLLLPERRIGLAAHDYQQAIAAPEVWLTRSIRSDDAETVASRWINRLGNLLEGLKAQDGPGLLQAMRQRGAAWLARAALFEDADPVPPAARPSPRPPLSARPNRLAVTDIKHLIRDPYAIYAKHVLRLRKLGPLVQNPDALSRGTVSHDVMEAFVRQTLKYPTALSAETLMATACDILAAEVPWPAARALWMARLQRIADWFVSNEIQRQAIATPVAFEEDAKGRLHWSDINFTLTARADRIDRTETGDVLVYDYKTGSVPSLKEQATFDKQLLIEAAMIEEGGFERIGPAPVVQAIFIGLGSKNAEVAAPLDKEPPAQVLAELRALILAYRDAGQGFTARRMMQKDTYGSDYDLLARYGEWDVTHDPVPEDLS